MADQAMLAMLAEWADEEWGRCRRQHPDIAENGYEVRLGGEMYEVAGASWNRRAPVVHRAILLAALLEAIEARGWSCTLANGPGSCDATVVYREIICGYENDWRDIFSTEAHAATALDALFPAYLEALRAETNTDKGG